MQNWRLNQNYKFSKIVLKSQKKEDQNHKFIIIGRSKL